MTTIDHNPVANSGSSTATNDNADHKTSSRKIPMVFMIPPGDAEVIYRQAELMDISVSHLIRSILYDRTKHLTIFDRLSDPYPSESTGPGRPIKRFGR